MRIDSLSVSRFRNYEEARIEFSAGTNILCGDNAQGKTNLLEAIYLSATTRSFRASKDSDAIRFGYDEGHIQTYFNVNDLPVRVDVHLRKGRTKGVAVDGRRVSRAADIAGKFCVVIFSPEDLNIVQGGPAARRRFIDMELCQQDGSYTAALSGYNKALQQRSKLLKDIAAGKANVNQLDVWDEAVAAYGSRIIKRRTMFISDLNEICSRINGNISSDNEQLELTYEPNVIDGTIEEKIKASRDRDIRSGLNNVGPHRDEMGIYDSEMDLRKYGSQGQQRTAAVSMKLSEIELIKQIKKDTPILLLDDVLSELDSNRASMLLDMLQQQNQQTIITCTGIEEFVGSRIHIDKVFRVSQANITAEN